LIGRGDLKAALQAYVLGHDRVWPVERKLAPAESATTPEPEFGRVPPSPRFGVGVPDHLEFGRGPGCSRSDVTGGEHPGPA